MKYLFLLSIAIGMVACTPKEEKLSDDQIKKNIITSIDETKEQLELAGEKNKPSHAKRLVTFYTDYANQFPQDSLAPEMLFMAGNVCIGLENYDEAISYFTRIDEHYKRYLKRPEAIYLSGFVADYHQNKKGLAKRYYDRVIELYPNHIFAKDAQLAINALTMSDEDLLKMFQEKNQATAQEE